MEILNLLETFDDDSDNDAHFDEAKISNFHCSFHSIHNPNKLFRNRFKAEAENL